MNIASEVLGKLNVLMFVRVTERSFKAQAICPPFFTELYKQLLSEQYDILHTADTSADTYFLADAFPYLECFLLDAYEHWQQPNNGTVKSGIWTEANSKTQKEYQFEARALLIEQQEVLLIHNLSDDFANKKMVYQAAREIALVNEKLKIELNQQQRLLQEELNKQVSSNLHKISKIETFLNTKRMGVLICKPEGLHEMSNQMLQEMLKTEQKTGSLFKQWLQEAEEDYPEIYRVIASGANWEGEFKSQSTLGSQWIRLTISSVFYSNQEIAYHVCVLNELPAYSCSNDLLEQTTAVDQITNLPNRNAFWQKLNQQIKQASQLDAAIALIYIDLDHFQHVNLELGHAKGDLLLSTIAVRLSRCIKNTGYLSHLGGDEYVVILQQNLETQDIKTLAEQLLEQIAKPIIIDGQAAVEVTASAGVAKLPEDAKDANELLLKADLAMSYAKENGRKTICFFNELPESHDNSHLLLHTEINRAIKNDEFFLVYQPIIQFNPDPILRVEALIRWQHPSKGLIGPQYFIDALERSGQIVDLSKWVLNKACERIQFFNQQGIELVMSVNMSAKDLSSPNFLDSVIHTVTKHQISPSSLEIEITETALFEDIQAITPILKQLKQQGISISLDDFGAGFSSLNYLKELPANKLKIDRAFIKDLPADKDSHIIASSIIKLAHKFNLKVVAEGVETKPQANMMANMGCEYAQGFYFHKPMEERTLLSLYQQGQISCA